MGLEKLKPSKAEKHNATNVIKKQNKELRKKMGNDKDETQLAKPASQICRSIYRHGFNDAARMQVGGCRKNSLCCVGCLLVLAP